MTSVTGLLSVPSSGLAPCCRCAEQIAPRGQTPLPYLFSGQWTAWVVAIFSIVVNGAAVSQGLLVSVQAPAFSPLVCTPDCGLVGHEVTLAFQGIHQTLPQGLPHFPLPPGRGSECWREVERREGVTGDCPVAFSCFSVFLKYKTVDIPC